jgi:hypothetical protein
MQVGLVVAIVMFLGYTLVASTQQHQREHRWRKVRKPGEASSKYRFHYRPETVAPPDARPWQTNPLSETVSDGAEDKDSNLSPVKKLARELRQGFTDMYGVETGQSILERGLWSPQGLDEGTLSLAAYLRDKAVLAATRSTADKAAGIFHIVVLGNSAPAGYGNNRNEAYASRSQELLAPLFQKALGLRLQVTNWAMNDLVEFPFVWCLSSHYLHDQPPADLIVWDFNGERASPQRMEAFVRNLVGTRTTSTTAPVLMVRNGSRDDNFFGVLKHYADYFADITVVNDGYAVQEFWQFQGDLPYGLADWDRFGAPGGSPDKLHPHLSVQEHWLVAWLYSMRLLPAIERAAVASTQPQRQDSSSSALPASWRAPAADQGLPIPHVLDTADSWLLGEPDGGSLACFTGFEHVSRGASFEPISPQATATTVNSNLHTLLRNHTIDAAASHNNLLLPKSVQFYHQGWVHNLEASAKLSKLRTKGSDFLGFTDWKTAYYGESKSPPLHLFVPIPTEAASGKTSAVEAVARLVLCQADGPLTLAGCAIPKDLRVSVGGVVARKTLVDRRVVSTSLPDTKPTCMALELTDEMLLSYEGSGNRNTQTVGLDIEIKVVNHRVRWNQGPCSIAHVLVESIL